MSKRKPSSPMAEKPVMPDEDNWYPTDEELKQLRPAGEVAPEIVKAHQEGRIGMIGPVEGPAEIVTTLRLDEDVIEHFKAGGEDDWRWRINLALRKLVAKAKPAKKTE